MAVGDAAGAAGLTVYDNSLLVQDVDTALNQRGDDIAADRTRLKALEAAALGVPKFGVKRSTNGQNVPNNTWTQMTAGAWSTPVKTVGGFTWSGGNLTVPRAGVYSIMSHVQFTSDDFYMVATQITRNSTSADTSATQAKGEWQQPSTKGSQTSASATASELIVPLNAGDVLRVLVNQRNWGGETRNSTGGAYNLTFSALWIDTL